MSKHLPTIHSVDRENWGESTGLLLKGPFKRLWSLRASRFTELTNAKLESGTEEVIPFLLEPKSLFRVEA